MNEKAPFIISPRGAQIDAYRPQVMGILNATPDSFYAGSRRQTEQEIAQRADEIIAQGATMIDVGAFSTRPGAKEVTETEELQRMRMALKAVRQVQPDAIVSVDTFRPEVARMAVEEFGADIINDVSEGGITGVVDTPLAQDDTAAVPAIFSMVGRLKVPYILMSVKPTIEAMKAAFDVELQQLSEAGCRQVILDPGFGFGKTIEQNYEVMRRLSELSGYGLPLLAGISRKRMIHQLLDISVDEALNGTSVLNTIALMNGASILRVHDVAEAVQAVTIYNALK